MIFLIIFFKHFIYPFLFLKEFFFIYHRISCFKDESCKIKLLYIAASKGFNYLISFFDRLYRAQKLPGSRGETRYSLLASLFAITRSSCTMEWLADIANSYSTKGNGMRTTLPGIGKWIGWWKRKTNRLKSWQLSSVYHLCFRN